jgi:PPK2 family polyphosphate:nucleotide phosphotransferase
MKTGTLAKDYRVESGKHFRLKDFDPADTAGMHSKKDHPKKDHAEKDHAEKDHAEKALADGIARTSELQDKLYAQDRWSLLLIFQALDAAGKDGAIKHVMSGVNPQGCQVYSFKAPSEKELQHDFLWRTTRDMPERGHIGIFNRSYYEEVLVVRVHPEIFQNERIPASLCGKKLWDERYEDIRNFELHMSRNGTVIRKFFLHLSKKEQKKRFLARLDEPEKNYKFSAADIHERNYWDDYQKAYEEMIANTSSECAPWYVVPADNKWFSRLVISAVINDTLEGLDLAYPKVDAAKRKELEAAKKILLKK